MQAVLLLCRPGFEPECAAEITDRAGRIGVAGYARAASGQAFVTFHSGAEGDAGRLLDEISWSSLIFVRQWFAATEQLEALPLNDRATPIANALVARGTPVSALIIQAPDSDAAKVLSPLCRALEKPVRTQLNTGGLWSERAPTIAQVCLTTTDSAWVGFAPVDNCSPWPGGVPRLKYPREAPSRSTLKLEEALLVFLDPAERERALRPGMTAVDLGAAPGGWTWQLVRRHIAVTAVDNGAMDPKLLDSGLVTHVRADGFTYRPARPVDWMVCDMVEQPSRIAHLVARWLAEGWCRASVFNLKLPMKKRYAEVQGCLERVSSALNDKGMSYELACKQLYHDREEVTVCVVVK